VCIRYHHETNHLSFGPRYYCYTGGRRQRGGGGRRGFCSATSTRWIHRDYYFCVLLNTQGDSFTQKKQSIEEVHGYMNMPDSWLGWFLVAHAMDSKIKARLKDLFGLQDIRDRD